MHPLEGLNPAQCDAVLHTEGPLLILAGAGSGKTRALAHRVAYLVEEKGVDPGSILAITFTNKAAREMRERVEGLIGPRAEGAWIMTFHAACGRILRRDIHHLGYGRNFVIYDAADQLNLVRLCLKELNLAESRYAPPAVLAAISRAKNELVDVEGFAARARDLYDRTIARVYRLYQQALQEANALDFDDMIMLAVRLFREFPGVLEHYQEHFRYLMIDEYQDTNHAQYIFSNLLASRHRNLCVVGDESQSIYGWRGADLRNILDFEKDYPEARVIKLEQNYRSTRTILEAANHLVRYNQQRKDKHLWTRNEAGPPLFYYEAGDEHGEALFVAWEILRLRQEEGWDWPAFAILYRVNAQSRLFEEVFIRHGIPYHIVGGLKFYERKEIKDLIAYLRLLHNPHDRVSLERVINVPRRGIGPATLGKASAFARELGVGLYQALGRAGEIPGLGRGVAKKLMQFVELVDSLSQLQDRVTLVELVGEVARRSGYLAMLEAEGTVEALSRLENVHEFLSAARDFEEGNPGAGLEGFLEAISLVADVDTLAPESEAVVLMTLHSAKGLEFPVVFMVGLEEGLFPLARALESASELEEERRLCYVGITRAEKRLYFTRARWRNWHGEGTPRYPSRFLREVPPELLQPLTREGY